MDLESRSLASSQRQGRLSAPVNSTSSVSRLFGRKRQTWCQDEIEFVLDSFQVDRSRTKKKTELFDLLCQKVVHDRGVDESAIPATKLFKFIRNDDGAITQPLIGAKPRETDDDEIDSGGSRRTGKVEGSLKKKYEDIKAPQAANLTDYWPNFPIRDCGVCGTELLRTVNTPWRRITAECAHRSTICLTCLQQHIQNQFAMNTLDKIPCPMCSATLSPDDIKAWTPPEFFERYGRISVQQAEHEGLSFRWCVAPGCQNGFLCDPDSESYATCDACGRVTCLSCNAEYHGGISCKGFQDQRARAEEEALAKLAKRKEEHQSMAEVSRISVKCPGKSCGAPIQKGEGCDHMTCSRCKHAFCYRCQVSWEFIKAEGNQVHQRSCPHYRPISKAQLRPTQGNGGRPDFGDFIVARRFGATGAQEVEPEQDIAEDDALGVDAVGENVAEDEASDDDIPDGDIPDDDVPEESGA